MRRWLLAALVVAVTGCADKPHSGLAEAPRGADSETPAAPPPTSSVPQPTASSEASAAPSPAAPKAESSPEAPSPPPHLPDGVLPGMTTELAVPGDRPLRVVHAGPTQKRALVYLPGMCGSTRAMDPWSSIASHYGTMIILSADLPCEGRPGTRWPKDVSLIQARIDNALAVVKTARGGLLDTEHLALIGYSQGAHRGEGLAGMYPDRYEYLILGGSPEAPSPQNLAKSRSVAIVGGEREDVSHMRAGDEALRGAGVRSKFFLLPRAAHGDYGPQGPEVLAHVFAWMFDGAP